MTPQSWVLPLSCLWQYWSGPQAKSRAFCPFLYSKTYDILNFWWFSFCTSAHSTSILKVASIPSVSQESKHATPTSLPSLRCDCCIKSSKRKIVFAENLSLRFINQGNNDIEDLVQKMVINPKLGKISTTYLMISMVGVESSGKELFYNSTWSTPNPRNATIDI